MASKVTGYDFWRDVLHSPRYVAAPMVDMSELSFRLLCRRYGAKLCYTPMFHSQQFIQDLLYRSDTFSTSIEDTPLIAQFCANEPEVFIKAASMVASKCSAIDLNLGCPQAIAKKGFYGAFLQDDWELIHSIVRKAAFELPVPVTCKMRILPGDINRSVEYAKMLENAGCSVLTVHGRTREQKGHATGLASWNVIKTIKDNVKIPVIANGNILSFDDIKSCLEYTGADAVMSAESLLHNPALFSGRNPPVWEIIDEYLHLSETCGTPIRYVRSHLFKILYLCIHQDHEIRQILAEASSFSEFYRVCDLLKTLPSTLETTPDCDIKLKEKIEQGSSENPYQNYSEADDSVSDDSDCDKPKENSILKVSELLNPTYFNTEKDICDNEIIGQFEVCSENAREEFLNRCPSNEKISLPIWLCHSRPRITSDNMSNRGCYSKYFKIQGTRSVMNVASEKSCHSKKKQKREEHHVRVVAAMKEKRKSKKLRRKQKLAEIKEVMGDKIIVAEKNEGRVTKKQKKQMIKNRMLKARGTAPKICIDLGYSKEMETKEINRLSSQLRRLYGSNRHSEMPFHLHFCRFGTSDPLYRACLSKNDGFDTYVVEMTEKEPRELFKEKEIIYLSPDSDNILQSLDVNKVYVIGGLIAGSMKKGLTLDHAQNCKVQTARLPIAEYLIKCSQNPGSTVLTVNQVFDILLAYHESKDWIAALSVNVPQRKGYCAPTNETTHESNVE